MEKVAHSKYAKDTLIFVIEDDAQNGPDHVDAHRSLALIAGPYVKQRALISKRFNTVTLLRTMEEVLGIKPLGLNDALQPPMAEVFSTQQATWTYKARSACDSAHDETSAACSNVADRTSCSLQFRRTMPLTGPKKPTDFDFTVEDKLDSESFNMVLWKGLKGESQPYPSERDGRDLSKHRDALLRELRKSKNR